MNATPTYPASHPEDHAAGIYEPVICALRDQFGERLQFAVLFGSQARGTANHRSDHDILVVAEGLPSDPVLRQKEINLTLLPLLPELPGTIAFLARTPHEVDRDLSPLLLDVCVDGICLFGESRFAPYRSAALAALEQSGLQRQDTGAGHMWMFPTMKGLGWELDWEGYRER